MIRLVINSGRSVIVWAISLAVGWQTFQPLQIVGFLVMCLGVLIFNDILLGWSSLGIKGIFSNNHLYQDQLCGQYFVSVVA